MIVHLLSFFIALFVCLSGAVMNTAWANDSAPIEITADQTMEWDRTNKQYIARGNAVAIQGDTKIVADQLNAEYTDDPEGGTKISRIIAQNNVTLTMPNKQLTASKTVEYNVDQGTVKATGNAVLIDGEDRLTADVITAWLDPNNQLKRAEATGHVVIVTPKETAKAARATYDAATNTAQLFDHVEITQGQNIVTGNRAEINLTTNISKVFGAGDKTRVKAVFYPSK